MKIQPAFLLPFPALLAAASAPQPHIYAFDIQPKQAQDARPVSPTTAFSIWLRRLGLTENKCLAIDDESALEDINNFGGWQSLLFDLSEYQVKTRLSLVLAGWDIG